MTTSEKIIKKTLSATSDRDLSKLILDTLPLKMCLLEVATKKILYTNFSYNSKEKLPLCCHKLVHNIETTCEKTNKSCPIKLALTKKEPFFGRCFTWASSLPNRLPEIYCIPILNDKNESIYLLQYLIEAPFSSNLYEDAINSMQFAACIYKLEDLDDDGSFRLIAANNFVPKITGVSLENMMGKLIDDIFPHLRKMGILQKLLKVVKTGEFHEIEDETHTDEEKHEKIHIRVKAYPLPDNCIGVMFEDITEKQTMLDKLAEKETVFQQISESAKDAIIMVDEREEIYYWNKAASRIFGYSIEEAVGKKCHQLISPSRYHESFIQGFAKFVKTGEGAVINESLELVGINKDGAEFPIELAVSAIHVENKWHAIGIVRDISKQLEARENQAKLVRQYTELINAVHTEMYIVDKDLRFTVVNKELCDSMGMRPYEVIGSTISDHISNDRATVLYQDDLKMEESGEEVINKEIKYANDRGEIFWFSSTRIPLYDKDDNFAGIVGLNQDVTDIHLSRQKLMQSEKLAAIGTLAAGVAHEINNPMGYISSNLNTMAKYTEKIKEYIKKYAKVSDPDVNQDIMEIMVDFKDAIMESQEGAQRVKKIVADLKSFSRVDKSDKEYADINDGIETTLNIVWNELKYKCKVEKDYGELPDFYCNLNQLNQVFMNLLVNASHAIDHKDGLIKITTRHYNNAITISIKDNGCGISQENLDKIFEPFFTTKDVGKGTGLGLSLVFDIVEKHNGKIDVKSELGAGSEFIIELPVKDE